MRSAFIFIVGIFLTGFLCGLGAYYLFGKRPAEVTPPDPIVQVFPDTSAAEINLLKQNIISIREKNTLDSLANLDSLGNIWAINYYIQHGRFPPVSAVPEKYRRHP